MGKCYRQALDQADKQVGKRTRMRSVSSFLEISLKPDVLPKIFMEYGSYP